MKQEDYSYTLNLFPSNEVLYCFKGCVAGPFETEPVWLKLDPCKGQKNDLVLFMYSNVAPWCVHSELTAIISLAVVLAIIILDKLYTYN